uniref:Uncharacterized protein n=1 Tax=Solanum lycopersicum TaxID=4081 RepID=A0A3Q7HAL6_SOLLC
MENYRFQSIVYRLQGITKSSQRFVPIPFASDGLTEEFYDLDAYNPAERIERRHTKIHNN